MWDLGVFSSSHAHLEAEREMGDQSDRKKDRPTDRQTDRGRGEGGGGERSGRGGVIERERWKRRNWAGLK